MKASATAKNTGPAASKLGEACATHAPLPHPHRSSARHAPKAAARRVRVGAGGRAARRDRALRRRRREPLRPVRPSSADLRRPLLLRRRRRKRRRGGRGGGHGLHGIRHAAAAAGRPVRLGRGVP